MDHLYSTGTRVGRTADFCRGGTSANPCPGVAPEVREVQMCAAFDRITGGSSCLTVSPLDIVIDDTGFQQVLLSSLTKTTQDTATCGTATIHFTGAVPMNPCPFAQYYSENAIPWTAPQPPDTPCPNCGSGKRQVQLAARAPLAEQTIFIEIDDARVWDVGDAVLQCSTSSSISLNVLPLGRMEPGDQATVTLDSAANCPAGSTMLIYFVDDQGNTTIDPVVDGG
jgi:hypothetical protein